MISAEQNSGQVWKNCDQIFIALKYNKEHTLVLAPMF